MHEEGGPHHCNSHGFQAILQTTLTQYQSNFGCESGNRNLDKVLLSLALFFLFYVAVDILHLHAVANKILLFCKEGRHFLINAITMIMCSKGRQNNVL